MTTYQMLLDTLSTHLFKMWKSGHRKETWNEENAREIARLILHDVEMFKMMQQDK